MISTEQESPTYLLDTPLLEREGLQYLCDFRISFEPVQQLKTPIGTRMNFIIKEGSVKGPKIEGEFLRGGGDWLLIGVDGVARLDVRATIRTTDGALIYVTNSGKSFMSSSITRRFLRGDKVPWTKIYARSSPLFETGAGDYLWMNSAVCIAYNEISLQSVHYRIYRVE
jgi:hypothetical protein